MTRHNLKTKFTTPILSFSIFFEKNIKIHLNNFLLPDMRYIFAADRIPTLHYQSRTYLLSTSVGIFKDCRIFKDIYYDTNIPQQMIKETKNEYL